MVLSDEQDPPPRQRYSSDGRRRTTARGGGVAAEQKRGEREMVVEVSGGRRLGPAVDVSDQHSTSRTGDRCQGPAVCDFIRRVIPMMIGTSSTVTAQVYK
ncbi:hypothetical protein Hdeb2414_s0314g00864951 [Helianthus debilis subsp. tardiflorus]